VKGREVYAKKIYIYIIVKHVVSNILLTKNDLTSVGLSMLHVGKSERINGLKIYDLIDKVLNV
jgi:hypothetical protein